MNTLDRLLARPRVHGLRRQTLALAAAALLALSLLPLAASAAATPVGTARLRVIDLAAFANPTQGIRLYLDGALQASTLGFGASSAYTTLWAGRHHVQIFAVATGKPVLDASLPLLAGHDYSYLIEGRLQGTVQPILVWDDNTPLGPSRARVRFANAIANGVAVAAHLVGGAATFHTLYFGALGAYQDVPAGSYVLEVTAPNGQGLLTLSSVTLAPGQVSTLFATSLTAAGTATSVGQTGTVVAVSATGSQIAGTPIVVPATITNAANLRLVDLVPTTLVAEPVRLVLDGQTFVGSIGYGSATTYVRVAPGMHNIQVYRLSGGAPLLNTTVTLAASSSSSYVLHQLTATTIGATLAPGEAAAPQGTARVRVGNMTVGGQAVRATVVGFADFGTINDGGFSSYVTLRTGHYTLQVFSTNGTLLTTLPDVAVSGGQTYTLFAVSGSGTPSLAPVVAISSQGGQVISPVTVPAPVVQPSVPAAPVPATLAQPAASTTAALRVVNLLRGLPNQSASFYLDGHPFTAGLGFGGSTVFANLPVGLHHMQVFGGNGQLLVNTTLDLKAGTSSTFAAEGMQGGPASAALLALAGHTTVGSGQARVRFANAIPGAGTLVISFVGQTMTVGRVSFTRAGSYQVVPAGTYMLMVRTTSGQVVLTVPHITLQAGATYTIFASGTGTGAVGSAAIVLSA